MCVGGRPVSNEVSSSPLTRDTGGRIWGGTWAGQGTPPSPPAPPPSTTDPVQLAQRILGLTDPYLILSTAGEPLSAASPDVDVRRAYLRLSAKGGAPLVRRAAPVGLFLGGGRCRPGVRHNPMWSALLSQ